MCYHSLASIELSCFRLTSQCLGVAHKSSLPKRHWCRYSCLALILSTNPAMMKKIATFAHLYRDQGRMPHVRGPSQAIGRHRDISDGRGIWDGVAAH